MNINYTNIILYIKSWCSYSQKYMYLKDVNMHASVDRVSDYHAHGISQ